MADRVDGGGDAPALALGNEMVPLDPRAQRPLAQRAGVRGGLARGAFLDRDFVLSVGGLSGRTLAVVAKAVLLDMWRAGREAAA